MLLRLPRWASTLISVSSCLVHVNIPLLLLLLPRFVIYQTRTYAMNLSPHALRLVQVAGFVMDCEVRSRCNHKFLHGSLTSRRFVTNRARTDQGATFAFIHLETQESAHQRDGQIMRNSSPPGLVLRSCSAGDSHRERRRTGLKHIHDVTQNMLQIKTQTPKR